MRLGKEQAAGYVEDIETNAPAAEEITTDPTELMRPVPAREPAATAS